MYAYFRGKIIERNLSNCSLIIEVNNIGFKVEVNQKTLGKLKNGQEVCLFTWTSSNDDGIRLCGFLSKAEKELFELLIKISGIGPKLALSILNAMEIDQFISAVLRQESRVLSAAPGVGKKTAERIILELKTKLAQINPMRESDQENNFKNNNEVYSVLEGLGFDPIEIDQKLLLAQEKAIGDDTELLVKFCLTN